MKNRAKGSAKLQRKKRLAILLVSALSFLLIIIGVSFIICPYVWETVYYSLFMDSADEIHETPVSKSMLPVLAETVTPFLPIPESWEMISFGHYEQDNITMNGPEEIEWIILSRMESKMLLLSRHVLDCQPFNSGRRKVTWETCSLRKWLNETFLQEAFTPEEQEKIVTVMVDADKNKQSKANSGDSTQDRIFLLSTVEADQFFPSEKERISQTSAFARAKGAFEYGRFREGCWWLRTPGKSRRYASFVCTNGTVSEIGEFVDENDIGVRPALWVNLE